MFDVEHAVPLRSLLKPKTVDYKHESVECDGCYSAGTVVLAPVHSWMDITISNALRRVLLGPFPGHAITAFQIDGVTYEFENINGVSEDVIQIGLNIKQVRLGVRIKNPINEFVEIQVKGPCEFRAGMIEELTNVKIINKDQIICTINSDTTLSFKFLIGFGCGYLDSSILKKSSAKQVGLIYLDALFNPIKKVSFSSEPIIFNSEDCKKVFITVETDGSIDYREAIKIGVDILQNQFSVFGSVERPCIPTESTQGEQLDIGFDDNLVGDTIQSASGVHYNIHLFKTIHEIEMPIRAHNAFVRDNIKYIGDLLSKSYKDLILMANLGRKSLETVASNIGKFGLKFDSENKSEARSETKTWPPADLLNLRKQYEARVSSTTKKKKNNDDIWNQ